MAALAPGGVRVPAQDAGPGGEISCTGSSIRWVPLPKYLMRLLSHSGQVSGMG